MSDKVYWQQLNGELIDVDTMSINHLRNVLKMIIKNQDKLRTTQVKCSITKRFQEEEIQELANEQEEYDPRDDFHPQDFIN
jgi:hypothetical protein